MLTDVSGFLSNGYRLTAVSKTSKKHALLFGQQQIDLKVSEHKNKQTNKQTNKQVKSESLRFVTNFQIVISDTMC